MIEPRDSGDEPPGRLEVEVLYWGRLGEKTLTNHRVELPEGATIEVLLHHLSDTWGFDVLGSILDKGTHLVMVDGSFCDLHKNLNRPLTHGGSVAVVPLAAGG